MLEMLWMLIGLITGVSPLPGKRWRVLRRKREYVSSTSMHAASWYSTYNSDLEGG